MLIKTLIVGSILLCLASADHPSGLTMIVGIKQKHYGVQIFRGHGARQKALDAGIKFNSHLSANGGSGGGNGGSGSGNGGSSHGSSNSNHNGGDGGANSQVPDYTPYTPSPPKTTTYAPTPTTTVYTTTTTTTTAAPTTYATEPPAPPPYRPTPPPYSPPKLPVHPPTYSIPSYRPPTPSYRHPTHPPRTRYGHPTGYAHPQYKPVEANYDWEYAVKDNHYNDFGHKESRHGYAATGIYYVSLPDGRIQTVTYVADENGYKPVVSFQGQAAYPDKN